MNSIVYQDIRSIIDEKIMWEKLRGKKILITGASGMIGSYLAMTLVELNKLSDMDINLTVLVRNPEKLSEVIRQHAVVLQQSVIDPLPEEMEWDFILHTASPASPSIMKQDPVGTFAANVLGAWNTIQAAIRSNSEGYLFLSSREIYGEPLEGQEDFSEDTYGFVDPLDPRSCYPEGKKAVETLCSCAHEQYGLNVKSVRLAHTYGPGMRVDDGRVQADFFRDVINNRDIVLKSEGTQVRTYTYLRDAVSGVFYILLNSPDNEIAYNISSEDSIVNIRQLAETMIDAFPERKIALKFDIPVASKYTGAAPFTKGILSSDKLKKLGWSPITSLKEGIIRTVAFLENQDIL